MADMQKFGRRPPRGGRGLKLHSLERELLSGAGRPPRGGRGLKFHDPGVGALLGRRPPRGGRGLKLHELGDLAGCLESPSSRRAWIEIGKAGRNLSCPAVALLAEGVD